MLFKMIVEIQISPVYTAVVVALKQFTTKLISIIACSFSFFHINITCCAFKKPGFSGIQLIRQFKSLVHHSNFTPMGR